MNLALAAEQWDRYVFCRDNGHLDYVKKADKCDDFFAGLQWGEADLAALALARRPALTINKIISTVSTVLGEQIFNRSEVTFRPKSGSPPSIADTLTKVWLQIAHANQLPWVRSDVFCDGIVRSRGFYDMRLDFTNNMRGEISISQMNSKNVVIDPDADEYDPDKWNDVIITKWLTAQDIAVLYNEEDAELLKDSDLSAFPYGFDSIERRRDTFSQGVLTSWHNGARDPARVARDIRVIERQYRKLVAQKHFIDRHTGDTRAVPDSWERNRIAAVAEKFDLGVVTRTAKRIRWTVSADSVVLHDDWSPYKHFTVVPYFPFFRAGRTIGIVENLLGPQELLNKASSQELHVINTTANSGWKIKTNSLKNMSPEELEARGAATGVVLELDDVANAEKIQPNQIPQGLERITFKAEEHIKSISQVTDSMAGDDRADVAAKAIQFKTARGSMNFSKILDNLERTDWLLARNALDIVQEYYTEQRIINITHEDLLKEPETITVNEMNEDTGEIANDLTLGEYDIIISSAPQRATLEDSQFEQAMALKEAGVAIPDDVLLENSRLMRRTEIVKRMKTDAESPEAQAQKELQGRAAAAEVANTEADAESKQADAALKHAKAIKEARPDGTDENGESPEMIKARADVAVIQFRAEKEMELAKWKAEQEMELKKEIQRADALTRRAQAAREESMTPATTE